MTYRAEVILDSISESGARLTTMEISIPRILLAEHNTHKDRERNASSSRAIPFQKMLEDIFDDPFVPEFWWSERSGMQGGEDIPEVLQQFAVEIWLEALNDSARHAGRLHNIGDAWYEKTCDDQYRGVQIHKSLPNRLLEPWMWATVIVSATQWQHFFDLRCDGAAEPHFQKLAIMMRSAFQESIPVNRRVHMPYVTDNDERMLREEGYGETLLRRISVARCARVSYLTHDGKRDPEKDLSLCERLEMQKHMSPFGHVAIAETGRSGPFVGWKQFRKEIPGEYNAN